QRDSETPVRILFQTFQNHAAEPGRYGLRKSERFLPDGRSSDHLVEEKTQVVNIGAFVALTFGLFRRHVTRRTGNLVGLVPETGRQRPAHGQTEIHDLDYAIAANHDVLRFQIAVNHTLGVSLLYSIRDLPENFHR